MEAVAIDPHDRDSRMTIGSSAALSADDPPRAMHTKR